MDTSKDGSLYMDLLDRPYKILRYPLSGGVPEVLGHTDTFVGSGQYMEPVATTNGRLLLGTRFAGRGRMLIGKPGGDFLPLLDTNEETSSPATALGNNEIALAVGRDSDSEIAVVSASDGRIVRQLRGTKGKHFRGLAASMDGKTIYIGADGEIWSIPAADGTPQRIAAGDAVTVNPDGRELVLTVQQCSNPVLVRAPATGGKAEEIRMEKGVSLAPVATGAHAMNKDGKILITVSPTDSWFYRVAMLDPATGQITPIKVAYSGDTISANWTADGRVMAVGLPLRGHVWRFRRMD
jgi:hypothetical protein